MTQGPVIFTKTGGVNAKLIYLLLYSTVLRTLSRSFIPRYTSIARPATPFTPLHCYRHCIVKTDKENIDKFPYGL